MNRYYGAIDIGGTRLRLALVSDKGVIVAEQHVLLGDAAQQPAKLSALFSTSLDEFLQHQDTFSFSTLVIAVPVVVSPDGQSFAHASNISLQWGTEDIKILVKKQLPTCKLFFINDVRAAVWGELWQGQLHGVKNGLLVNVGTGLSTALLIDGQVFGGSSGSAGEIAFCCSTVDELQKATRGDPVLENQMSGRALQAKLHPLADKDEPEAPWWEQLDHPQGSQIFVQAAQQLALHLFNFTNLLNPEVIVVGGGLSQLEPLLEPVLTAALNKNLYPPELLFSHFPQQSGLLGCAYYGMQQEGVL